MPLCSQSSPLTLSRQAVIWFLSPQINFAYTKTLYKWDHSFWTLLCLASFTQHVSEIHLSASPFHLSCYLSTHIIFHKCVKQIFVQCVPDFTMDNSLISEFDMQDFIIWLFYCSFDEFSYRSKKKYERRVYLITCNYEKKNTKFVNYVEKYNFQSLTFLWLDKSWDLIENFVTHI